MTCRWPVQYEAAVGLHGPAAQHRLRGQPRILVRQRQLVQHLAEAHFQRAVQDDAERAVLECSHTRVTVCEKFGSASEGIAISSWLLR